MVLKRLFRAGEDEAVKRYVKIADRIESLGSDIQRLSDAELRARTGQFRARLMDGQTLGELLPEAFAVVREAAGRTVGQRHFKVQLVAGAALHAGHVAEMTSGGGKTLACVLPVYLDALTGAGVHVATANGYLARRDARMVGRICRFLGVSVSVLGAELSLSERRAAYAADITYGRYREFGWDYLRDNMVWQARDMVQRGQRCAIVDDADSILLDDARIPLNILGAVRGEDEAARELLASITPHSYFRLYEKLSATASAAQGEAAELERAYGMSVVGIPSNGPIVRVDDPDAVHVGEQAKLQALVEDVAERHRQGQPVLVGTAGAGTSETLSGLLGSRGVPHEVLNAGGDDPVTVIAEAGRSGMVTVVTDEAGRGLDVVLGGDPRFIADQELRRRGLDPVRDGAEYEAAWPSALSSAEQQVAGEAREVRLAGGLYVVGAERHRSRRIEDKLRGRVGRQGDPGASRFYVSMEDGLMRRCPAEAVESIEARLNAARDESTRLAIVADSVGRYQSFVESRERKSRQVMLEYEEVINQQRAVIYGRRRRVVESAEHDEGGVWLREEIQRLITCVIGAYIDGLPSPRVEDPDLDRLRRALGTLYPIADDLALAGESTQLSKESLLEAVLADVRAAYRRREAEINEAIPEQGGMSELERQLLLSVMDRKWRQHLAEMRDLLDQKLNGPDKTAHVQVLAEYNREGNDLFQTMVEGVMEETVGYLFHVQVGPREPVD